jgi:hypothetical protein
MRQLGSPRPVQFLHPRFIVLGLRLALILISALPLAGGDSSLPTQRSLAHIPMFFVHTVRCVRIRLERAWIERSGGRDASGQVASEIWSRARGNVELGRSSGLGRPNRHHLPDADALLSAICLCPQRWSSLSGASCDCADRAAALVIELRRTVDPSEVLPSVLSPSAHHPLVIVSPPIFHRPMSSPQMHPAVSVNPFARNLAPPAHTSPPAASSSAGPVQPALASPPLSSSARPHSVPPPDLATPHSSSRSMGTYNRVHVKPRSVLTGDGKHGVQVSSRPHI